MCQVLGQLISQWHVHDRERKGERVVVVVVMKEVKNRKREIINKI